MKSDSLNHFYHLLTENRALEDDEVKSYYDNMIGLNKIIFSLENDLMDVRKLPIKKLFNKFYYVVRNTAKKVNKNISLELINEDLRIDSSLLNEMEPVLTHIVRNSIDHGIESAERRKLLGKSEVGNISLRAEVDDEFFYIYVKDDGGGIDPEKIKRVILKKKLATEDEIERMSDEEVFAYIFQPGFSSAEKVTDISGRGVGLDVVKTTFEKLNGEFKIHSKVDEGTTFELIVPQKTTLVTKESVIVESGNQKFAIPLERVLSMSQHTVDRFFYHKEKRMIKINDDVYPVHYLDELLNRPLDLGQYTERMQMVIVKSDAGDNAIIVNNLVKVQTIVNRFEYDKMAALKAFCGYTVSGNGDVILVIDSNGIIQ